MNFLMMGLSIVIGVAGWFLAKVLYVDKTDVPQTLARQFGPLYRVVRGKLYFDEIFMFLVVFPSSRAGVPSRAV